MIYQTEVWHTRYKANNVLVDEVCDDFHTANYWKAPDQVTTPPYLIVDLGCRFEIHEVLLRNSHNDHRKDRWVS